MFHKRKSAQTLVPLLQTDSIASTASSITPSKRMILFTFAYFSPRCIGQQQYFAILLGPELSFQVVSMSDQSF